MNKMTIEIKNGVFTRQWTKGVNTKIFKDYKILDYIENFDTQAMFYYLDTKGNLVLNKELSISKKFTNLKKNITNLILELATEKENNGYLFNYKGLTLLQSYTSRDKELITGKAVSIAVQKSIISSILPSVVEQDTTEGFFKWFGLRDVITKKPRVVLLNNLMFLLLTLILIKFKFCDDAIFKIPSGVTASEVCKSGGILSIPLIASAVLTAMRLGATSSA